MITAVPTMVFLSKSLIKLILLLIFKKITGLEQEKEKRTEKYCKLDENKLIQNQCKVSNSVIC